MKILLQWIRYRLNNCVPYCCTLSTVLLLEIPVNFLYIIFYLFKDLRKNLNTVFIVRVSSVKEMNILFPIEALSWIWFMTNTRVCQTCIKGSVPVHGIVPLSPK